ncbi:zinc-ribbon domain-containing protein [Streptomyces sp. NPDC004393]
MVAGAQRGLTPEKATPKMRVAVWWRCAAGHEWLESISNRTALPKWKNGDIAACRECVGYRVSYTYPVCGHSRGVPDVHPGAHALGAGAVLLPR